MQILKNRQNAGFSSLLRFWMNHKKQSELSRNTAFIGRILISSHSSGKQVPWMCTLSPLSVTSTQAWSASVFVQIIHSIWSPEEGSWPTAPERKSSSLGIRRTGMLETWQGLAGGAPATVWWLTPRLRAQQPGVSSQLGHIQLCDCWASWCHRIPWRQRLRLALPRARHMEELSNEYWLSAVCLSGFGVLVCKLESVGYLPLQCPVFPFTASALSCFGAFITSELNLLPPLSFLKKSLKKLSLPVTTAL